MNKTAASSKPDAPDRPKSVAAETGNSVYAPRFLALLNTQANVAQVLREISALCLQTAGELSRQQVEMGKTITEIVRRSMSGFQSSPAEKLEQHRDCCVEVIETSGKQASQMLETLTQCCCNVVERSADAWTSTADASSDTASSDNK